MPEMQDELRQWYAAHHVADTVGDPQYRQLCNRYKDNPRLRAQFNEQCESLEQAKTRLEKRLEKLPGPPPTLQEQVKAALIELSQWRRDQKQSLYYDLIARAYKPHWSETQQTYFENAWRLIASESDFFLSFTTRYPSVAGDNPVNKTYRHFIREILGPEVYDTSDRRAKNLLAVALYRMLEEPPLRHGFEYTVYENDNSRTENKLKEFCAKSVIFIQLVQNIMFHKPEGQPNYCFFEYNEAKRCIQEEGRMLFVVAEPSRDSLVSFFKVPAEYEDWYNELVRRDPPYLKEARIDDPARVEELRKLITDKILRRFDELWNSIFANVPA